MGLSWHGYLGPSRGKQENPLRGKKRYVQEVLKKHTACCISIHVSNHKHNENETGNKKKGKRKGFMFLPTSTYNRHLTIT